MSDDARPLIDNPYRASSTPIYAGDVNVTDLMARAWDRGFAAGRGAERERIVAALEADYRANVADGADGIYTDGLHDAWRLTVRRAKRDDLIKPVSGSSEPRKETT